MRNSKFIKNKLVFSALLVSLGILSRTVYHMGPNVEFVTAATLLSASYLGRRWAIAVPLAIMFITDLIIGNTNIFLFTWSGYLLIGCFGNLIHLSNLRRGRKIFYATGLGTLASLWFYLWTNSGVWLLDSWGMYPKTLTGLVDAYLLGLPFLKYNLAGNLIFVPLAFTLVEVNKSIQVQSLKCKVQKFLTFNF